MRQLLILWRQLPIINWYPNFGFVKPIISVKHMATTLLYYSFQSTMILLFQKMYVFFTTNSFKWFPRNILLLFHVLLKKTSTNVNKYKKSKEKNKFVTEYFLSYLVKGLFNNSRLGTQNQLKNEFKTKWTRSILMFRHFLALACFAW